MKLWATVTFLGFKPKFDSDRETHHKFEIGQDVEIDVKQKRNIKFHRKFMALINMAYSNQDTTKHFEAFRKWMITSAGYYDLVTYPDGTTGKEAHSISFANMENDVFERLYNDMIQVVILVTKATPEDIEKNLVSFM